MFLGSETQKMINNLLWVYFVQHCSLFSCLTIYSSYISANIYLIGSLKITKIMYAKYIRDFPRDDCPRNMLIEKSKTCQGLFPHNSAFTHTPSGSTRVIVWLETVIHSKNQYLVSGQLKKYTTWISPKPEPVVWSHDTLYCKLSINQIMDVQYQRCTYGCGATLLFFEVLALVYRCMDVHITYGRSHDNQFFLDRWFTKFFKIHVCCSSRAPSACRSSVINSHLLYFGLNFSIFILSFGEILPHHGNDSGRVLNWWKVKVVQPFFSNILNFVIIVTILRYFIGKENLHFDKQSLLVLFFFSFFALWCFLSVFLSSFSVNLLAFNCDCCSLAGYATYYRSILW